MMRLLFTSLLLLATAQAGFAAPLQDQILSGSLKTLDIAYQTAPVTALEAGSFSANNLRLELKSRMIHALEFEFALNTLLLYSDPATQTPLPTDSANRRFDLERSWNRGNSWSAQTDVDRLSLQGRLNNFDWKIGRQAVGFGRITLFSPLDVVAPFAPSALDTDTRPGVDALHGVQYFGLGGQLGATLVLGDKTNNNSYLVTFSENRKGIDLLGIVGLLRDREMIGFGLAGNLGPLGIKTEISHYQGKDTELIGGDLHDDFNIGALELWYRFDSGLILLAEYLHNGAGAESPDTYISAATSATFNEGLSFLLGQEYLLLGPSWELHPLATLSGLLIRNLEDDSTLLRPQIQLSLADNLSIDLFYSFNFGLNPQVLTPSISIPRSEFGATGDSGGLLLRWYF